MLPVYVAGVESNAPRDGAEITSSLSDKPSDNLTRRGTCVTAMRDADHAVYRTRCPLMLPFIGHKFQVKVVNRSKRSIEFELVDMEDLSVGRLAGKGVAFSPAIPTVLGSRESTMVEVSC